MSKRTFTQCDKCKCECKGGSDEYRITLQPPGRAAPMEFDLCQECVFEVFPVLKLNVRATENALRGRDS